MSRNKSDTVVTPRDRDLLSVLQRGPHTAEQLLKLSLTFREPFTSDRYLRKRLQALRSAGWLNSWRYATTTSGTLQYYKLSRAGFRLLNGPTAPLPPRSFFDPVSMALQEHTQSLVEFLVHTEVSAVRSGCRFTSYGRENEIELRLGPDRLRPDGAFEIATPAGDRFNFFVELDNATEPVCSRKERESWQRKLEFYNRWQDHLIHRAREQGRAPTRFRVLAVFTRSLQRIDHVQKLAARILDARIPPRHLIYAIAISDYLKAGSAITARCWRTHHGQSAAMIPSRTSSRPMRQSAELSGQC